MKKKISLSIFLLTLNSNADEFSEFQKQQQVQYLQFEKTTNKEFTTYKKAYEEAYKEFSKELAQKWPSINGKADISTTNKFVQYNKDLTTKQTVDYKTKNISIEVIATSTQEAKAKIKNAFNNIIKEDVENAYKKDFLEKKISQKTSIQPKLNNSTQKLISDVINTEETKVMANNIQEQDLVIVKYKDSFIYKANVKMPDDITIRKAKQFKTDVLIHSEQQKVPADLIYAIMHSESSFNPMARSHIPAFGLMQIVPKSAGIDSYQYLYKEKKLLSSAYLYNSSNNIKIGSAYLHILYYIYLKKIKDPQSRLYCTIAAYNTGAGNVAKTFIGTNNISKATNIINTMNPEEVYNHLLTKLPYLETRKYLKKVNERRSIYNKLLVETI